MMDEFKYALEDFMFWIQIKYISLHGDLSKIILQYKNESYPQTIKKLIEELELIIKKSEADGAWGYHMQQMCGSSMHGKTESFVRTMHAELVKPKPRKNPWINFLERYFDKNCKLSLEDKINNDLLYGEAVEAQMISILQTITNTEGYERTAAELKEQTGVSITIEEMKELVVETLRILKGWR